MKLSTVISTDVSMIRVTHVAENMAYKRIHERSTYDKELVTTYGLVTDIAVTDEMQVISALEFTDDYSNSGKLIRKTFSGTDEVILLPVDSDEFVIALEQMKSKAIEAVETAKSQLLRAEKTVALFEKVSQWELTGEKTVQYEITE